jgi:hypothetical protein
MSYAIVDETPQLWEVERLNQVFTVHLMGF